MDHVLAAKSCGIRALAAKSCGTCGKTDSDLQRCAACKSIWYCDVQCQKKDRKSHKKLCNQTKANLEWYIYLSKPKKPEPLNLGVLNLGSSTESKKCDSCGKSGVKLWRCEGCKEVRYCGSVCQKRDWPSHEENCCVIKIVHTRALCTEISRDRNLITGKVMDKNEEDIAKYIGKDSRMVVKIQTNVNDIPLPLLTRGDMRNLRVYNESGDYDRYIESWDKNYALLENKILSEGLFCAVKHPLLRKMYFKAHLNPDLTLDVYLNCTYEHQNW